MAPECRAPGMSAFSRLIDRRNVDLPQPDGPMSAVTARDGIVRSTSWSACLEPYQNENFRAAIVPGCWESGTGNGEPRRLAACWAHARRKFYEVQQATASPVAAEALQRIAELYAIETTIRGQTAAARLGGS